MTKSIAVFGGSFNPPGSHHRAIAEELARLFDEVIVVPCGPRPDKPVTNDVDPIYRAAMADMTFGGLPGVRVELFDLEASTFTPTCQLDERFAAAGQVWHVVAAEAVRGGAEGRSAVQTEWQDGARLWQQGRFAVVTRPGVPLAEEDLPPQHRVVQVEQPASAAAIRSRLFHREDVDGLLLPRVEAYVLRHGLYRGVVPRRSATYRLTSRRFRVYFDEFSDDARQVAEGFAQYESDEPDLIVVIGGDGTMLRAIHKLWRLRVPFYGVNVGHLGFLLNETSPLEHEGQDLVLSNIPLLYAEAENTAGECRSALAFNDAWVERATGQTAWIQVKVNGEERVPQLVADGALVATSAGSTAYARAMGGPALPLNTPAMLLVGSNVLRPAFWRPVVLPLDSHVELTTLDPDKRPLQAYIDGVFQGGTVRRLSARVSNSAAVEMVFPPQHDPAAKLARIQFPRLDEG